MAINFSNINLEVIDVTVNASPDIFVNVNGVTFSKRVLEDLNYPQYVQYCYDAAQHIFAVRVCKSNVDKAVSFSKPKAEQTATVSTTNKNIHDVVAKMIPDYDPKKRYKVVGYFDADNRVVMYDMSEAVESAFRAQK